jgi:hypothetical protein
MPPTISQSERLLVAVAHFKAAIPVSANIRRCRIPDWSITACAAGLLI